MTTGEHPSVDGSIATPRRRFRWIFIAIAIFFALFYVYDLFEAISNVVGVTTQINSYNQQRAVVKLSAVATPWLWLVIDLLLAPVVYMIAFIVARRRPVLLMILVFFVGLAVVAATTLSVERIA